MTATLWAGVALFGGLGAVARLFAEHGVRRQLTMTFPVGTTVVNVSGAFALGLLTGLGLSHSLTTLLGTGFLGAYTTFSGWMLETRSLAEQQQRSHAAANIAVSVVLGLAAAAIGYSLGRLI
ncbi:MAG: fluoride efflux transporter CrcB [Mycobacteriaceae bacterium]